MVREATRHTYAREPDLFPRVQQLLDVVFPGIAETIVRASRLGLHWQQGSTPFVVERGSRILAHVGVLEMQLMLAGERRRVAVVHGVATDPKHRRRGYYRAAMSEALAWCDERYPTIVLNTGQPELYEPFGFRHFPESRFVMDVGAPRRAAAARPFRRLNYEDPSDVARLLALLEARAPVSTRLGVVAETQAFAFNECREAPYDHRDLDALVCMQCDGGIVRLFDVVARSMPTLDALLAAIDEPVTRVECYFAAQELDARLQAEPHVLDGDHFLMFRGPFLPIDTAAMLARPARC